MAFLPPIVFSYSFAILWLLSLHSHSMAWMFLKNRHTHVQHIMPIVQPNWSSCDVFFGSWVYVSDGSYPLYSSSNCASIDSRFKCTRPDTNYLKYRWVPANCELPAFNGVEFLTKMKGKSLMFVGDSLSRNQWESLICMISTSDPKPQTQILGGDPLSTANFTDYGVRISYYKALFLVDIDVYDGKSYLKLDDIRGNGNAWLNADVLCFNTGHWWFHSGPTQGWDYVEYGGNKYQDLDRLDALKIGLTTWARWVESNVDMSRTKVFFQSISPTHYGPGQWNMGPVTTTKSCYGETEPSTTYPATYPDQAEEVVERVLGEMRNPPFLLNITGLSAMRKDAHPSIYGGEITPAEKANPETGSDCSHWCLPGLPDTWNLLFNYALFL